MTSKSSITLINFYIFNSSYSQKEGDEHKKILYYYPENSDIDTKIKNVGLCEAIIKFVDTFSSKCCEAVHTQKTRLIFLQPETDIWMVMVVSVPCQQKVRDGLIHVEYYGEEIQDHVYQSVLLTTYRLFTLVKGTFSNILNSSNNNLDVLKQHVDQFFSMHLSSMKTMDQADLLDIFQGIHFLPLERYAFLKIQCFINHIEAKFRNIKYVVFLYNDQLVWSGLDQEDMQILYQHLSVNLIPFYVDSEIKGGIYSTRCSSLGTGMHFGRFMTGPKHSDDISGLENIPKVYLNNGEAGCHLIVYRALNATLCLLIDATCILSMELFKDLDAVIGSRLSSLASEIGEQYLKTSTISSGEPQVKYMYMYFNHMNLAQKTTIHTDMKGFAHAQLPPDIMKVLADINHDLSRLNDSGEIIGKTVNDCWIVGKLSDCREFYLVLQQKNANIVDVNEEVKKLSVTHFQNIFILD